MAQLMPLPLTVSCSSKIQIGFTFLVPAHPGSPGKRAVKRVCDDSYNAHSTDCLLARVKSSEVSKILESRNVENCGLTFALVIL